MFKVHLNNISVIIVKSYQGKKYLVMFVLLISDLSERQNGLMRSYSQ